MSGVSQSACSCSSRARPEPVWYEHDGLERAVVFAPGYRCELTGGSSHGQHGMEVRWYLRGPLGVVQFVMFTDWPPSQPSSRFYSTGRRMFPMAADLGWHATSPQYDGQEGQECDLLRGGGTCFYDGSGLNAELVMERFFVEGETAIWAALTDAYRYLDREDTDSPVGRSATSTPVLWRVVDQRLGGVDALLLGDQPNDSYRIGLTIVNGPDGPDIDARVVYPCRVCGWDLACHNGEDCHS